MAQDWARSKAGLCNVSRDVAHVLGEHHERSAWGGVRIALEVRFLRAHMVVSGGR